MLKPFLAVIVAAPLIACNQVTLQSANASPDLRAVVTAKAKEHGVPPALAHGVIQTESGYRCGVKAGRLRDSARGIAQIKPSTARSVGVTGNLMDCNTGLEAGMRYLRQALDRADGDWCGAATLYNRGIYARPTRSSYCRTVLRYASRTKG